MPQPGEAPPSLSPSLLTLFNSLSKYDRLIFSKVFTFIYRAVLPYKVFTGPRGILRAFWLVENARRSSGLAPSQLALLSFISYCTDKGSRYVHSSLIYQGAFLEDVLKSDKEAQLFRLRKMGYITRRTRDPGASVHYRTSHSKQPVFVTLSPAGIKLLTDMEREIYAKLKNTSLDELTGRIKKPRPDDQG